MRLVLARHGQTPSNITRALDSRPPGPPLTALGHAQAAALAQRIASWPVSAVHASRAVRAQQTAAPLAAALGMATDVIDGAHEVDCGDFEGRCDLAARTAFDEVYDAWWTGDLGARLPGGESALDVLARFLPAVAAITEAAPPAADVVLVAHGAAIRLSAGALLGEAAQTRYVPNTGLVVLAADPTAGTGWVLEAWDDAPPVPGDVTAGGEPA